VSWREDITAGLPPPEDEGQANLQRDIVDELGDHLSCAVQREMRKTSDERAARRAVLARFGSVKRTAYRLWFDAMKETIMNQRIAMISNAILAAACIAVCVIAFLAIRQTANLNAAILEKLESLQTPAASQTSEVWANLTVDVRENRTDGEPVPDYEVALVGKAFNANDTEALTGRTDEIGRFTFGPVRPGRYVLQVSVPSGGLFEKRVILYPGEENKAQLITPIFTPEPNRACPEIDLPEDLRGEGLWCRVIFERHEPDSRGNIADKQEYYRWYPLEVMIDPNGNIIDVVVLDDSVNRTRRTSPTIDVPHGELRECLEADAKVAYELSLVRFYIVSEEDETQLLSVDEYSPPRRAYPGRPTYHVNAADSSRDAGATVWRIELPEHELRDLRRRLGERRGDRSPESGS
jgi:hypothetical protein